MLAPDRNVAIANLVGLINANARAMLWAHLVAGSVLPPLSRPPAWYREIDRHLAEARDDAQTWLAASGPALFAQVSEATLRYGTLFASVVPELDKAVGPSRRGGQPMTEEERAIAQELIDALLAEARHANATVRAHMDNLGVYQQRIRSRQADLNFYRQQAVGTRAETSAKIRDIEKEVSQVREVLAANEVNFEGAKMTFATGTMGIIYAVTIAPVFAAGALSMGIAVSVAGLGMTIWKLERYTSVLKDSSAKLNKLLRNIREEDVESLMTTCIIDNLATLESAADKTSIVLSALISVWQQTISDLTSLREIVSVETSSMNRFSKLQTLETSVAVWRQIMQMAEKIQQIKFETTHHQIVV